MKNKTEKPYLFREVVESLGLNDRVAISGNVFVYIP